MFVVSVFSSVRAPAPPIFIMVSVIHGRTCSVVGGLAVVVALGVVRVCVWSLSFGPFLVRNV
eukprot:3995277-Heterocapsa_arctica.AAC.1